MGDCQAIYQSHETMTSKVARNVPHHWEQASVEYEFFLFITSAVMQEGYGFGLVSWSVCLFVRRIT